MDGELEGAGTSVGAELGCSCKELVSRHSAILLPLPLSSAHCPPPCVALITSWEATDLGFCLQHGPCTLTTALHRLQWDISPH